MGRLSNEEKAARAAAEKKGTDGVVGNTNTPGTNTHEGILEQQKAAENPIIPNGGENVDLLNINTNRLPEGALDGSHITTGRISGDGGDLDLSDLSSLNKEELSALNIDSEVNEGNGDLNFKDGILVNPDSVGTQPNNEPLFENGIMVNQYSADAQANNELLAQTIERVESGAAESTEKPKTYITKEDFEKMPILAEAGLKIGDEDNLENLKKFDDFMKANPWKFPTDHPDYRPEPEGTKEYVFHGDHLSEDQINDHELLKTYDWDQVTAPQHLRLKPM